MKTFKTLIFLLLILMVSATSKADSDIAFPDDPGWPRVFQSKGKELTIYQPQVDFWNNYKEIQFRCAISVETGDPTYSPISGTQLMRIANTDVPLFLNSGDGKYCFLVARRWFRSSNLDGPWTAASNDVSADFARIPDNDPVAFVKASVPGTIEAKDAVLLASVTTTKVVAVEKPAILEVAYSGEPKFQAIPDTKVQYAVNSPQTIFLVKGGYYCCEQGIRFSAGTPNGPWILCKNVPSAIYAIPPSHPTYNVTYVVVQSTTPTTVTYTQTAGYSGEYVAATGVLMFGAGMIVGAMIADDDHYYYPPYPAHYSYGCGARYSYAYGGYYRSAQVSYGPYGGAGAAAAYNPATGTAARGGYRSTDYGSAAAVKTSRGTKAAAWDNQSRQGAVAKTKQGNVYAGKDGNVYKKDSSGNWTSNSGSGWESVTEALQIHQPELQP